MVKSLVAAASVLALTGAVSAQYKIENPSADNWWVANSINVLTWNCKDSGLQAQTFTVSIDNDDHTKFNGPLAIIPIQNNFDCSKTIDIDHSNQTPNTGYRVLFSDVNNITNVYARSDAFEIKPVGSPYPASVTPTQPGSTAGQTGTSTTGGSQPTGGSAVNLQTPFSIVATAVGALLAALTA